MGRRTRLTLTLTLALAPAAAAGPDPTRFAPFQFLGPAPIGPTSSGLTDAGAVQAILVAPGHKNVVWIGTVNGGVWKTNDFHPGEPTVAPHWMPLTDDMPSLSIGGLSMDPTVTSDHTVVAALGAPSSAPGFHGPYEGVLRTTDDGHTWKLLGDADLAGQDLTGVAARGATILVTSSNKTGGGLFISTDTGHSFQRLSGTTPHHSDALPDAPATAIVGDPAHTDRLWVGFVGTHGGVFQSDDTGQTWKHVGTAGLDTLAAGARKLALDAQSYAHDEHELYVAVIDPKPPSGSAAPDVPAIFRLTQTGSGAITTDDMGANVLPAFETFDQGKVAIAADPLHDDQFFVTGDEGLDFRCTRAVGGTSLSCTPISDKSGHPSHTGHGTAPHADARMLIFDGDTALVATDDGGVFLRNHPREDKGDWFSKNGDLGINEDYSCAYDSHGNVSLCGSQDNGVVGQAQPGQPAWPQLETTDGGDVAVSDELFPCPWQHSLNCSARYFSRHDLADFTHLDCDLNNTCKADPAFTGPGLLRHGATIACTNPSDRGTCGDAANTERTPMTADRFDASHIAIASSTLYESTDGGATVSEVSGFTGTTTPALLMGGERSGHSNANLLLAGSSAGLFARTSATATAVTKTTWDVTTWDVPEAIAVDHDDWSSAWVVTSVNATTGKARVVHGTDVGGAHETWIDVTGDLSVGGPGALDLRAIAHVGGTTPYIVVGADDGLYAARTDDLGHWWKLTGMPNVVIGTLSYSATDDILVIGTVGRSAWSMNNASQEFVIHIEHVGSRPPKVDPHVLDPAHVNPGDPVEHTVPAEERRKRKKPR